MTILLAGAGGQVGRRVRVLLEQSGHQVRAITGRDLTPPGSAHGLATACQAIVSCAGASVSTANHDKRPYSLVDTAIHRNLILEAKRAAIRRFVYLSVHVEPHYAACRYILAHESVRAMLVDGEMDFTVIRPTGIHSAFADLLPFARRGVLPLIASGEARTNPIHPQDVAGILVRYLEAGPKDFACGGPEVLTRRQINEIIARAAQRPNPFMPKLPGALVRLEAKAIGLFHPRLAELIEFFSYAAVADCIAPSVGTRSMKSYFEEQ